jgi:hypothetical protein
MRGDYDRGTPPPRLQERVARAPLVVSVLREPRVGRAHALDSEYAHGSDGAQTQVGLDAKAVVGPLRGFGLRRR